MRSVVLAILLLGSSNQAFAQGAPGSSGRQVTREVANLGQGVFTSNSPRGDFCGTSIPPIAAVKGQIIQVTVVLSFQ